MTDELRKHASAAERFCSSVSAVRQNISDVARKLISAKDALRTDGELFQRLVQGAQDLIYTCDSAGFFTYVNPTAARAMCYGEDELVGLHFLTLIRPDYRDQVGEAHARQLQERTPSTYLEFPALTKGGETIWFGQHLQLIHDEDEKIVGVQAIARDITRQKEGEERLRRSEARYRSLIQGAAYGIYRTNDRGRLLQVNPALVSMLGYDSADELLALGETTTLFQHPAIRDRLIEECRRSGQVDGVEVTWKRKDGARLAVRLSARAVWSEPDSADEFQVMAEDVSERQRLEDQLRQAQKIEAVGQLAGGIAHNFNNLLTAILGYTELLLGRTDTSGADRADLEEIRKASERAAALTGQLLAFSRKQAPMPEEIDLNCTVTDLQEMLKRVVREDIRLTFDLASTPAVIRIDPNELEQVILNLALNARDALPAGGHIRLEVAHAHSSEALNPNSQVLPPGDYVRLSVSDDGAGIAPAVRPHLFEPFFTTKPVGKGTGLGLASVYGIVQHSNGFISVDSELGKGTTFTLHFPALSRSLSVQMSTADPWPSPPPVGRTQGQRTILLVEDEDAVRSVASALLRQQGYHVLDASTPQAAMDIFELHAREIDLLLTDVVMPEMSGPALAQRLVGMRPELQVLFISGYATPALAREMENPKMKFLSKPFQASALVAAVRDIFNHAA
jgi:two-component system cell cycle sensor histidine kinase/response regulator CckA